ncbi:YqgQ family protein [Bacillus shivajii]|uniref:YqgQ family protein n=1 Tax=Bacillus shivajii TaxID=1983719 RepID=UPI001CF976C8|nr:YqgQ family protein [Bacillus shivajii]UCZ54560.1 YqgQ family protein [Bacillus shivajii]
MTFFDVQQLLKKYGTLIYTGDRSGDLQLMEDELKELYELGMIEKDEYQMARLVIIKEKK